MRMRGYTSSKNNVAAKVFIPILRKALCRNTKSFFSVRKIIKKRCSYQQPFLSSNMAR